jgi:signal transduction histidine kinase/ActR/RegA family two-component response regulator
VDSITARPSSASSLGNDDLTTPYAEIFALAARLASTLDRLEAARALARRCGATDLIIFVKDAEVDVLLPAQGFLQTLPQARRWNVFLSGLVSGGPSVTTLPYPDTHSEVPVLGKVAADASVLLIIGGNPSDAIAETIALVVPVLTTTFRAEQALVAAKGQAAVTKNAVGEAKLLADSLENARHSLHEALAKAEAANHAKDQFLAVLSHELRTPLAPVLTTATSLLADPHLAVDLRESLELIRRNAELEARLIDDLLDLTRVTKGKMPLSFSEVDAHVSIRHTLEICRSDIYRKKLELVTDLCAERHFVRADPARLQQVLWNLVKNAVKFTPEGGRITIQTADDNDAIRIDVCDTGMGIEPDFLEKIFNAFEQTSDMVTRHFGGLGLGLAISKALAEAQGGKLFASSEGRGKGATFTLRLPASMDVAAASSPAPEKSSDRISQGLKILLVEDHSDTAAVMSRLLRGLGHEVTIASSIATSIDAAGQQSFDLVMSDLGLPDGSGLDLMRQLRELHGLPGIAVSGYGMEDDLRQTREAGFIAHLTKPVSFNQVEAVLLQFSRTRQLTTKSN